MNLTSKITIKGQVTLPAKIRKKAQLKTGDKVYFSTRIENGEVVVVQKKLKSIKELTGIFKKPKTVGEIESLSWI
jgi:AbrB family looped-hinge helix DNA binding protein